MKIPARREFIQNSSKGFGKDSCSENFWKNVSGGANMIKRCRPSICKYGKTDLNH